MRKATGRGNSVAGRKAGQESAPGCGSQVEETTDADNASKGLLCKGEPTKWGES